MNHYQEAIDFLYQIRLHGTKLGLETMEHLLSLMGRPQNKLRFVHIAGTNGKGSVAALLESVLRQQGYRTGLYTSPHLLSFCERIRVDQRALSEWEMVKLTREIQPLLVEVEQTSGARMPTFFETVTAMALRHFVDQNVEIVLWETGMGGRLDATNVITPVVSVITSLGMDHAQYLGGTLAEIAAEKAGIIKKGHPCVVGPLPMEAVDVVLEKCVLEKVPLRVGGLDFTGVRKSFDAMGQKMVFESDRSGRCEFTLGLLGAHQVQNAAVAVAVIEELRRLGLEVGEGPLRSGLEKARWPGRLQVVRRQPYLVLDGAHNPDAAGSLAQALLDHFAGEEWTLILGILQDKDYAGICAALAPLARRILLVPVRSPRSAPPALLEEPCHHAQPDAVIEVCDGVAAALEKVPAQNVLVAGSLFLVGEALGILQSQKVQSSLN